MKTKIFKRIPAFMSAVLMCSVAVCGQYAYAVSEDVPDMPYNYGDPYNTEDTTEPNIQEDILTPVTTEVSDGTVVDITIPQDDETAVPLDTAPVQSNSRKKASVKDYDSSLSAVSYEFSYPEYTYEEDFSNYTTGQQYEQAKKDMIVSFRTANPVTSVKRDEGEDPAQFGHVGEIPVPHEQDVSSDMSGEFTFVTYGWGHGVGMSQNGADFYATYAGWSYQDILAHYYPNTYLMNTGLTDYEELTINGEPAGDTVSVVAQIVNREIGGSMNYEAIKAQAVAVYTYLKYHDDDSADLLGKPDPPQVVIDACTDVLGEALYYNGSYALTMFSASTGGCTANCGEVFYADIPYLISVPSDYDELYDPHYGTVTYYPASEVKRLIEAEYKITLSDDPGNWIQPTYSTQTGYVTDVNIDNQISIRGYELKLLLDLKSSKFNLTYTY
ncbi:MAG: sporulation protein [Ruminococcus flavefaciens]|nr:sporulation protein [Ruminococcus flavefaciens]